MATAANNIERVSDRVYLVGGEAGVVVNFSRGDDASFEPSAISNYGWSATINVGTANRRAITFQPWGLKNDMPTARERLIADNNVVGALIECKRDIHIGLGLMPIEERFEGGQRVSHEVAMPTAAADFFDSINIENSPQELSLANAV